MADTLVELKNKKEERADQVRRYVDEYAALALEADRIKQRMDWLKGQFETMATVALKDTKLLSISYWGSQNSRVTVTNTATVKPISLTMVKKVLGEVAGDFVKSETVDKMTESCKRLLAMVCQGNFTMGSLEETIRAITAAVDIPVVAIGGIHKENILQLKGTGVDGVALVSAIFAADDIETECKELKALSEQII